ncbi:MAG TPA: hypothetical protein VG815_19930 [Chloroflexota bacterium]|nr:hypothetical protein [Chloroflexota bacterium]
MIEPEGRIALTRAVGIAHADDQEIVDSDGLGDRPAARTAASLFETPGSTITIIAAMRTAALPRNVAHRLAEPEAAGFAGGQRRMDDMATTAN